MAPPRAKPIGIDRLTGMPSVADIVVAGDRPPAGSEFVHQMGGVAEVSFDAGAIDGHIAGMDHEVGVLVGDPRRERRPIVGEMWLVPAQMRVGKPKFSDSLF